MNQKYSHYHPAALKPTPSLSNSPFPSARVVLFSVGIYWLLQSDYGLLRDAGAFLFLAISIILILRQPYLGIVLTMVSLPLTEVIYQSSVTQYYLLFVGGVTFISYLMQKLRLQKDQRRNICIKKTYSVYILAFLFLFWTFSTNPQAALFLGDRIWLFTLMQLFLLTWLAGELFDTPEKHRLLMGAIVLATLGSAIVAVKEANIGENISTSVRATGLSGGANTTVRLFVFSLIMLTFLLRSLKSRSAQLFGIGGIVVLTIGVVMTVSRTGFLLLGVALVLIFWDELVTRIRPGILLMLLATFVVVFLWIPDNYWIIIFQDATRSVFDGTDTIGLRYRLWDVAWLMWQDNPLVGVGIGRFGELSWSYGLITGYHNLGAHSIYFTLLAETGIVGLALYAGLMLSALIQLFHVARNNQGEWPGLARTWLFILLLVLIGGITKNDQYDKFPWLIPGLALAISRAFHRHPSDLILSHSNLPLKPSGQFVMQNNQKVINPIDRSDD